LKNLRLQRGFTQERVSELSGISYKYYQAIESGRRRDLKLSTLEKLAKAYRLEIHQLLDPDRKDKPVRTPLR
jgi:transcriptional regulator with XRE-family HTH domain